MMNPTTALLTTLALSMPAMATQGIPLLGDGIVGIAVAPVPEAVIDGLSDYRTIRLVVTLPAGYRLDAVAGNIDQNLLIEPVNGSFYQNEFGGATSLDCNEGFFNFAPALQWDSFITIGALTNNGTPYAANNLQNVGVNFTNFEAGDGVSADNGTWFILAEEGDQGTPSAFTDVCGRAREGVTIAQLTLLDDPGLTATVRCSFLLQGQDELGESWQVEIDTFETTTSDRSPADVFEGCAGDYDADDTINVDDLLYMLSNWTTEPCLDLNADEVIDVLDVAILISGWGACTPAE
jgi:hypothetical protein